MCVCGNRKQQICTLIRDLGLTAFGVSGLQWRIQKCPQGGASVGIAVQFLPIFPKTLGIKNGPRGEGPRESPLNPYTGQVLLKAF